MNILSEYLKKNKIIFFIITAFFAAKLLTLINYKIIWWDSSVYIGIGKHIYSLGNSGLWEETRPLAWPLMLGLLWKIGLNPAMYGKILEFIFGSLCIFLAYLIGRKLFDEKIAILASLFLALSPTFFFFNGIMLTEIVSTFFSLAAIYYLMEKRHFMCGLFFGIAFLTRFLQLFVFIGIIVAISIFDKNYFKILKKILIGFIMVTIPYFVINQVLYSNLIYPFLTQFSLTMNSGWHNYHTFGFYFIELFKENFLYLLSFLGLFLAFKSKAIHKKCLAITFLILFVFFNLINQKEMRFLIILMPYMYLLVSFSIFYFYNKLRSNAARELFAVILILSFVFSITTIIQYYKTESVKLNEYSTLQKEFESAKGNIWISSPVMAAFSDNKIGELMYYPFFNGEKKNEMINQVKDADFVFLDSCDLACRSADFKCEKDKTELIADSKKHLKTIYYSKNQQCEQFIFTK